MGTFIARPVVNPRRNEKKSSAITIVEILIVIVVIAILGVLIGAATFRAIDTAKVSACASRLGQLGRAHLMYADSFDGLLPPYPTESLVGKDNIPARGTVPEWKTSLMPYVGDGQMFYCPADHKAGTILHHGMRVDQTTTHSSYRYSIGVRGRMVGGLWFFNVNSIEKPDLVLLIDYHFASLGPDGTPRSFTVHGERSNVFRIDGSVKLENIPPPD